MTTEGSFPAGRGGMKWPGREIESTAPHLMLKLGISGAILLLPNASTWREKGRLCLYFYSHVCEGAIFKNMSFFPIFIFLFITPAQTEYPQIQCDFRLQPLSRWELRSSGLLRKSSGNFSPTFRDKLSVPYTRVNAVPLQAWSGPEGSRKLRFLDFMTTAQDGGKVVSLRHRPPLPREIHLVLISVTGWVDPRAIVRPAGLCQWKIPMTPSGIEPATCRFVA
jgi:hypothetical protein